MVSVDDTALPHHSITHFVGEHKLQDVFFYYVKDFAENVLWFLGHFFGSSQMQFDDDISFLIFIYY